MMTFVFTPTFFLRTLASVAILALACLGTAVLPAQQKFGKKIDPARHEPAKAVANLDVHPELAATLFAAEPALTNPTNLDIDYRGRVWVCDVMNYRRNNGKRPEGDRILIFEDNNGDGKFDKVKTFYQNKDIDSAMGICVLGNKVIVSCSPNVFVFTFDENDKILKKEALFTKTGQVQHDHSAHSFVFGPDGRLYWNFGNYGKAVRDKDGKQVIDLAGNAVVDNGKPYHGGMVFRCEMDGSDFEVLAHNFRNNYETAVDAFGALWQSDNDDDGNRGVRINYVMEFGNYGFLDEFTREAWRKPRTNIEKDIPLRHWHLNDPGVVPNLLQTFAGSPCGILVYEGTLLPKVFHRQMIHADAGPNVVRAYPVAKSGAGYTAKVVDLLNGNKRNNWFRPADVCVAPDGSLFVTDWYDPGVGGHAQRDIERGRIFWVAPPRHKYTTPKFDFKTASGACDALKNPALSVRYLAWTALHEMGKGAESELLKMWNGTEPVHRAQALWLLGRIEGRGEHYVKTALSDTDPDLRVVGIRLARQLKLDLIPLLKQAVRDRAPEVRRECAIALRYHKSPEAPALWAELAEQHDGKDRWYLEALGIGADKQWDSYLGAWQKRVGSQGPTTVGGRDVVWRSRATATSELLAKLILDPKTPSEEMPRFFRAFDFQPGAARSEVLVKLAFGERSGDASRHGLIALESFKRLKDFDPNKNAKHAATVDQVLENNRGTATFVDLVDRFKIAKYYPDVLAVALKNPGDQLGVTAMRSLLQHNQQALIQKELDDKDGKRVQTALLSLTTAADDRATQLLLPLVQDAKRNVEQRRQAVRALARTKSGAGQMLKLAQSKNLPKDLLQAAGAALTTTTWKNIRDEATTLFPAPPAKDRPLPPLPELARTSGDAKKGLAVFKVAGTCANCHVVNGEGKDVGPDLSEIGKKLSREALLESILFPSAGISHGYDTFVVELNNGGLETGLLMSESAESVSLKGSDALVRTIKRGDIAQMERSSVSLMPEDLTKAMTAQDLVDVVEYMLTLREARAGKGGER